ncbi:MAG TPA: TolC family protein [archaeon]|nr:TolC family protein [archaeon]
MSLINHDQTMIRIVLLCFVFLSGNAGRLPAQTQITLEAAIEIAMENSPDILSTKLDLERSSELLKAQQAALKSQFSLNLNPFNYSRDQTFNRFLSAWSSNETKESISTFRISQPIKQTDGTLNLYNRFSWQDSYSDYNNIRNKAYSNNLYLEFNQPLFTYNRSKLQTQQLELGLERTELTFAIQKLSLERQVAQNFFDVYQSKMSLDIAVEEQKNQQLSYEIIKNKVDAGLQALEELYQAELNLATSKSKVQNQQVVLENALDAFKQLIGIPLPDQVTVEADVSYKVVDVDLEKAIDNGLKSRMELRQRQISIENAEFTLVQTSAQNEFKGNVTLSYGVKGTNEQFNDLYDKTNKTQSVGLSFDIPLWDWGEKKSRIKADQASIEKENLSFSTDKINITIGIRQAYRTLNNLENQIEIARQNVRNAELTYEINLERYKNGDLTSMDLNLFQSQLSEKKMGLIQALIGYKLALLDMKVRSLWDFERNEPVLPKVLN